MVIIWATFNLAFTLQLAVEWTNESKLGTVLKIYPKYTKSRFLFALLCDFTIHTLLLLYDPYNITKYSVACLSLSFILFLFCFFFLVVIELYINHENDA